MGSIADNIKILRSKFDITQAELARVAGVTENAVSKWENGYSEPRMGAIERIAACYGLKKSNIIETGGMSNQMNDSLYPMPPGARPITSGGRAVLPYRGRIHAGDPIEADDVEEVWEVPEIIAINHPHGFVLDVMGDCMSNIYPEGCHIVVDPTLEPQSGHIGAFMLNGEVVMRRMLKGANLVILSPDSTNDSHKDIVVSGEDELITYGRIVWFQAAEEL